MILGFCRRDGRSLKKNNSNQGMIFIAQSKFLLGYDFGLYVDSNGEGKVQRSGR